MRMSVRLAIAVIVLAVSAPTTNAYADYTVESERFESRGEASTVSRAAAGDGVKAKVVRSFEEGAGWRYFVRIDGLASQTTATALATRVAERTGRGMSILAGAGEIVGVAQPTVRAAAATDEVTAILTAAAKAHGGTARGPVERLPNIVFRFARSFPGGEADHVFARQGGSEFLEITSVSGGVLSRTLVTKDGAWLTTAGQVTSEDRERAAAVLATFAPEKVIPFILTFPHRIDSRRELSLLYRSGEDFVDGVRCHVLVYDGDKASDALRVAVGVEDHLVREVAFGDTDVEVVHRFASYREIPGWGLLPERITTSRGDAPSMTVLVKALDPGARPPADWFVAPKP